MKLTYTVTGMTCNGCSASVTKALQRIAEVTHVTVNLENAEVTLTATAPVTIKKIQEALPPKYKVAVPKNEEILQNPLPTGSLKQLYPLGLIFAYLLIAAVLLNVKSWQTSQFMYDFMGLFYIVFSFFKLLDVKGFATSFKMYDPLAKRVPFYAKAYPFIEVLLGLMLLQRLELKAALALTLFILGITTIGVTQSLLKKETIQCACLGTVLNLPMTKATFIENSIMLVMALTMLILD